MGGCPYCLALPRSANCKTHTYSLCRLTDQFMAILPAGSTTRRDGVLDIASHTPVAANPPDLGPKGYFSQTSDDRPGGSGSTKLHSKSFREALPEYVTQLTSHFVLQW